MHELSLIELESELAAELPQRALMRRRRMHLRRHVNLRPSSSGPSSQASAAYGSAGNANDTQQGNSNLQGVINAGSVGR